MCTDDGTYVSNLDQSDELSVLDGDNGNTSPDVLERLIVQLEYYDCLVLV